MLLLLLLYFIVPKKRSISPQSRDAQGKFVARLEKYVMQGGESRKEIKNFQLTCNSSVAQVYLIHLISFDSNYFMVILINLLFLSSFRLFLAEWRMITPPFVFSDFLWEGRGEREGWK